MDKKSVIKLAQEYADIVCESMPVKEVILYGSHAKNSANENSDIDIAIVLEELEDDYLDVQIRLFKLRCSFDLRIEPVLIEDSNDKSGFLKEIKDTGIEIYSAAVPH
ncbi:MAG: nucleotidyltransferase family protein [Candidatus Woesearchaeota archaeon]